MLRPCLLFSALLLAAAANLSTRPAAAQDAAPALRANVTITGDTVRIGDLIENAGAAAEVPVFRAPDLGTTGAVSAERVVEAIRPHHLIGIDTRGLSEVIVTRASRRITAQEISTRITQALTGQGGLGEARNLLVRFDHEVRTLQVEPTANGDLQVVALKYDPRTGRFDITFDLPSSVVLHRQSPRFTGTIVETVDAVTVEHPVERGEVLKATDLAIERRPKADGAVITDANAVIGQAARHQLRPGQPLRETDLMKPALVERNDMVTIIYEAPGIMLTLRGQAQESGGLGDTVGVLNLQSKRVVQGVVSGPGRVTVGPVTTRFVDNAQTAGVIAPSPSDRQQEPNPTSAE